MNSQSDTRKTSIATNITFVVYFLINLIIRTEYTQNQLREDAVKDNTVGKATISDRSYAVMLTGLFFTLGGEGSPALNIDGTWKHGTGKVNLRNEEKKFLQEIGWKLPNE